MSTQDILKVQKILSNKLQIVTTIFIIFIISDKFQFYAEVSHIAKVLFQAGIFCIQWVNEKNEIFLTALLKDFILLFSFEIFSEPIELF